MFRGLFKDGTVPALEGLWVRNNCNPRPKVTAAVGVPLGGGERVLANIQNDVTPLNLVASWSVWTFQCRFSPSHLLCFGPEPDSGGGCRHCVEGRPARSLQEVCTSLYHNRRVFFGGPEYRKGSIGHNSKNISVVQLNSADLFHFPSGIILT